MSVGYRSVLTLDDSEDAVRIASEQTRSWLRRKFPDNFDDAWTLPGAHRISNQAEFDVIQIADERDGSVRQLMKLTEHNSAGTWVVRAIASSLPHSRRLRQSIVIELDKVGTSVDSAVLDAKPPALVRLLLEATHITNHQTELPPSPTLVRNHEVPEVVEAILDPLRSCHVVVGVSPGEIPDQTWLEAIAGLTKDSLGVTASFAVSEDGADSLNQALPPTHQVPRGGVRTFAPRVDFEDPSDSVRHRILTPTTFIRSIRRGRVGGSLPAVHAENARRAMVEAELPYEIRRSAELLGREEVRLTRTTTALERRQARQTAPAASVAQAPRREVSIGRLLHGALSSLFNKWVSSPEVTIENSRQLDELLESTNDEYQIATDQIEHLLTERGSIDVELEQIRKERDEAELAAALEAEDAREHQRRARVFEYRLRQLDRADQTFVEPETNDFSAPSNMQELLERISTGSKNPVFDRVRFTGDTDTALKVDKRDQLGRNAARFWDYVMVLYDYSEFRKNGQVAGGVHAYLNDGSLSGRKCSPQRHAARESESTMSSPKLVRDRTFPVPERVCPEKKIAMMAHFKPTHQDTFAPECTITTIWTTADLSISAT